MHEPDCRIILQGFENSTMTCPPARTQTGHWEVYMQVRSKTELTLEPQPTERWMELVAWTSLGHLLAKAKISTFLTGFKHDPESYKSNCPGYNPKLIAIQRLENPIISQGKRQSRWHRCWNNKVWNWQQKNNRNQLNQKLILRKRWIPIYTEKNKEDTITDMRNEREIPLQTQD